MMPVRSQVCASPVRHGKHCPQVRWLSRRDPVTHLQVGHPGADLDDGAGALMSGDDGQVEVERLRRRGPLVDLPVGAASDAAAIWMTTWPWSALGSG